MNAIDFPTLRTDIDRWGAELGFQRIGVTGVELGDDEAHLLDWLDAGFHGEMDYMARHGSRRSRPAELQAGYGTRDFGAHGLRATGARQRLAGVGR